MIDLKIDEHKQHRVDFNDFSKEFQISKVRS